MDRLKRLATAFERSSRRRWYHESRSTSRELYQPTSSLVLELKTTLLRITYLSWKRASRHKFVISWHVDTHSGAIHPNCLSHDKISTPLKWSLVTCWSKTKTMQICHMLTVSDSPYPPVHTLSHTLNSSPFWQFWPSFINRLAVQWVLHQDPDSPPISRPFLSSLLAHRWVTVGCDISSGWINGMVAYILDGVITGCYLDFFNRFHAVIYK